MPIPQVNTRKRTQPFIAADYGLTGWHGARFCRRESHHFLFTRRELNQSCARLPRKSSPHSCSHGSGVVTQLYAEHRHCCLCDMRTFCPQFVIQRITTSLAAQTASLCSVWPRQRCHRPVLQRLPTCLHGVRHQHCDCHRPNAARHRRDRARFLRYFVKRNIAHQPITAIKISADRVIFSRLQLRECATVTVAFASLSFCMRRRASGLPTIMLRPRMTTCAPLTSILLPMSKRCTPSGVHGTNPIGSPSVSFAMFCG